MAECRGDGSQDWHIAAFQNGQPYSVIVNADTMCITAVPGGVTLESCQESDAQGWTQGPAAAPQAVAGKAAPGVVYNNSYPEQNYYWRDGLRYCWHPYGWNGPGWYVCGQALKRGAGYGGPARWNNWVAPGQVVIGGGGGGKGAFSNFKDRPRPPGQQGGMQQGGFQQGGGKPQGGQQQGGKPPAGQQPGGQPPAGQPPAGQQQGGQPPAGQPQGGQQQGQQGGQPKPFEKLTTQEKQNLSLQAGKQEAGRQAKFEGMTTLEKAQALGRLPPGEKGAQEYAKLTSAQKNELSFSVGVQESIRRQQWAQMTVDQKAKGFVEQQQKPSGQQTLAAQRLQGGQQKLNQQQKLEKKKLAYQNQQKKFQGNQGGMGAGNQGGMGGMGTANQGGMGTANQGGMRTVKQSQRPKRSQQSDILLKHEVVRIGTVADGIGLYRFQYTWSDQVYVGVMAHEVAAVRPDAVMQDDDGYLRVYYDRIGAPFDTWQHWRAIGGQGSGR
jgi:hypothetical protein